LLSATGALVVGRLAAPPPTVNAAPPPPSDPPTRGFFASASQAFDRLLQQVGAFFVVCLAVSVLIDEVIPAGALSHVATSHLDVVLTLAAALPSYVNAAAVTPLAAVLLDKGLSPGALLAGLALAPTLSFASWSVVARRAGARAASAGGATVLALAFVIAEAWNQVTAPPSGSAPWLAAPPTLDPLSRFAAVSLLALLVVSVWRHGARIWLSSMLASGHEHHDAQAPEVSVNPRPPEPASGSPSE
jgi:hypothetical protein